MSWLNMAISVVIWLTARDSVVTVSSQKEEKVDNGPSDRKSLFWKARRFIELLPALFQPPGWQEASKRMLIVNTENGSTIVGEIGDQIGRGDRATIAFPDEFAELEHQELVESGLAATADCVIYGSTVPQQQGQTTKFYELEHQFPEERVFVFQWFQDPRKRRNPHLAPEEEPWYIKTKAELSPTVFAAQVLLDYNASSANSFIPSEMILAANAKLKSSIQQPPQVPWTVGVDAAGGGNDKTVIWRRKGRLSLEPLVRVQMDGVQLAMYLEDEMKKLLKTAPIAMIGIERDGPGGSCADQLKYGPFAGVVVPVHTGTPLGDGMNYNLRAWLHRKAKEYLEEGDCHIPSDPIFFSQATAIRQGDKAGRLLIESKAEYRARFSTGRTQMEKMGGKSPDRWDAFVLTFIPPRSKPLVSIGGEQMEGLVNRSGWKPLDAAFNY